MKFLMTVDHCPFGKFVLCAAVRTLDGARVDYIKEDARMHAPERCFVAWTMER